MSYKLNRRRLAKAFNRLRHLPRGLDLLKYSANKLNGALLRSFRSTKVPFPSSITFEVTNHCNLGCITCPREYDYGKSMDKGLISLEKMKRVVDEITPYIDAIGLTGLGETLLYKKLEDVLRYIKQKNKGIQTFISTNAHVPGAAQYIERLTGLLDTVQISIDGTGSVYETVRLKSNYSFFLQTAKEIVSACNKSGIQVMFNFVALKENYTEMKEVVKVAAELGVPFVNITPVNLSAITSLQPEYYSFFQGEDFKNELRLAVEAAKNSDKVELSVWDIRSKNEFKKCHLPWNHFYISWDGYLTPCCAKPFPKELHFGNVFESSLMECLNSKGYRAFRDMWYRNVTPDFCKKCHVVDLAPIDVPFDLTLN
jgi:radical SAM protein with 4Fe4S-binding SPASM domain